MRTSDDLRHEIDWNQRVTEMSGGFQGVGRFLMQIARERQAAREGTAPPEIPNLHDWSKGKPTYTRGTKAEYIEAMLRGKTK